MFTVLIIDPDGNERLLTDAVLVRRLFKPDETFKPGILINFHDGSHKHYGPNATQGIYVMNEKGSTVANYRP